MGFHQRDANTRAKERYIQQHRDHRYKMQMFRADIERKKQCGTANNKNNDIDGQAIDVLQVKAGHNQTDEPEDELDCRKENRGFPVVHQDILPDIFIAFLENTCKQQFFFYL
jgi:hypothetical protein